ncbi:hypothetical protein D9M73_196480 [compost metagenome]
MSANACKNRVLFRIKYAIASTAIKPAAAIRRGIHFTNSEMIKVNKIPATNTVAVTQAGTTTLSNSFGSPALK